MEKQVQILVCLNKKNEVVETFEVHENAVLSALGFALANNDSRHNLLPQIRLALVSSGHDYITDASRGKTVETTIDTFD
ncbi:hypothetical protein M5689_000689 [Euphorbia peplus]|nr:hypothetical protein M5689_000689 [Euphorbia peplus]